MSAVKPKSKGFRFRNSFVKRLFSGKEIVKRQSDSEPSDGKDGRHNSSIKTLPAKTSSNADCLKEIADDQVASSSRTDRAVDDSGADDDATRTDDALASDTYHILSEPAASSSNPAGDQIDSVVADCSTEERVRAPPSDVASDDPAGTDDRSDDRSDERSDDARPAHDIATCCHARLKSMADEFRNLAKQGWYWGPLSRYEAEEKLLDCADGSFLVRDSADERYLLSISFRSYGRTLHTRIEYSNGNFSFFEFTANQTTTYKSAVQLIADSMRGSRADHQGAFCYSRSRDPHSLSYPVLLAHPVSRLAQVRSLRYLCRFTIRQFTRVDHVENLPLPHLVKGYLNQSYF